MSALVDESYYRDVYKGAEVYDDLGVLLDRASDIVRQHTLYRLDGVDCLPFFMQDNVRKAVCAQAEFIDQNGGLEALTATGTASFSIGKFSMSAGSAGGGSGRSPAASPLMLSYLEAVGLLYRGGV
ncbi:MAG: hypothetical protein K1W17_05615 [Oscillospiraceae bacterium]